LVKKPEQPTWKTKALHGRISTWLKEMGHRAWTGFILVWRGAWQVAGTVLVINLPLCCRATGAWVRRQASLSLPWVFPFLCEGLRLDVRLGSLCRGCLHSLVKGLGQTSV
jgi:hypothetical protein